MGQRQEKSIVEEDMLPQDIRNLVLQKEQQALMVQLQQIFNNSKQRFGIEKFV
ncbi:hypothetical protein [Pseudoflavonifractor phocaeensis]|uniref:hypothetical protein n=1 Tax=Pseudoflavonifractor phocaeensis TaxID=1870988 RepID=UPI0019582B42|nr:hypothetical protein [Pseudoflavonifractor phocaeensis]MBM6724792.1 hypothetical protein [Pseudoflavonifractor phocaeensis]